MVDVITCEVIRDYMETVASEIFRTLIRSAMSVMFNEAHDCSAGVFYYDGEEVNLISRANSMPVHLYGCFSSVKECLKYFKGDLNDGDVILVSDPYHGGTHICDYTMLKPVFYQGKPIFFPSVRGHFLDVGAPYPGSANPMATEVHQEGFRFPPLKVYEKGELRRDVWQMLVANTRLKHIYEGDLNAMIGSCRVGENRLQRLVAKYGFDIVLEAVHYILDASERKFRNEISKWPDGTYSGQSVLDTDFHGQKDINVNVKITVQGDGIVVDFSGSHPQTQGLINSVPGNTLSYVFMAFTALCPDIPVNSGFFRPIRTILPEGSVVNPHSPAPAAIATICIGADIGEAMMNALAKLAPERVGTISLDLCIFGAWGMDPRYQSFFVTYDYNGSPISTGGALGCDGWGGWAAPVSAVQMESMEQMETKYPLLYLQGEYVMDGAAPGKWRGAPAFHMQRTPYGVASPVMHDIWIQKSTRYALKGYAGGAPGRGNYSIVYFDSPKGFKVDGHFMGPLDGGEIVFFQSGGGGGWGSPLERDPKLVLQDIQNELVSTEAARSEYGVVLTGDCVDEEKTAELRNALKNKKDIQ
ncbi:MAG: hydantoinase B/oxoprolinase family protein [Acidobacteria bacterium]|nr:hydantoinase B/oxoprolinase family protein [Acidobacteriota bacterium]